jgi:ABC-2 type transport system permease protein
MASTFILWRNANALSNLLEYPIWLVTGLLVPISLLPGWVTPLAWVLAPTWGVRAIRDSALGGGEPALAVGMCLALAALYLLIGSLTVRHFEKLARDRATLSLT